MFVTNLFFAKHQGYCHGSEDKKVLARPVLAHCSIFFLLPQMLVVRIEARWKLGVGGDAERRRGGGGRFILRV